jgi:proteasome lid subunit RPN8/RPN11
MASRLVLASYHLDALERHAAETYPEECCGLLLGRALADGAAVEQVRPAANVAVRARRQSYVIDPRDLLAGHKRARAEGLEVVGYYHSHPDRPALPSERDRRHAWPGTRYVILGMAAGAVAEVRGWRLLEDRLAFAEEEIEGRR